MKQPYQRLGMIPTLREFAHAAAVNLSSLTDVEFEVFYFRYGEFVDQIVTEARSDPALPMSLGSLNQYLAEDVIASHLGNEWVESHIVDPDRSDLARSFVGMGGPKLLRALSLHRIQEMARRLVTDQVVVGGLA